MNCQKIVVKQKHPCVPLWNTMVFLNGTNQTYSDLNESTGLA